MNDDLILNIAQDDVQPVTKLGSIKKGGRWTDRYLIYRATLNITLFAD